MTYWSGIDRCWGWCLGVGVGSWRLAKRHHLIIRLFSWSSRIVSIMSSLVVHMSPKKFHYLGLQTTVTGIHCAWSMETLVKYVSLFKYDGLPVVEDNCFLCACGDEESGWNRSSCVRNLLPIKNWAGERPVVVCGITWYFSEKDFLDSDFKRTFQFGNGTLKSGVLFQLTWFAYYLCFAIFVTWCKMYSWWWKNDLPF